jgi:hypothetical protein
MQACLDAFEADVGKLIMVDGELYSEIAEPMLEIEFNWDRQKWNVNLIDLETAFTGGPIGHDYASTLAAFSVSEIDEVFGILDRLNIDAYMSDVTCSSISDTWVSQNDFRKESVGLALNAAYHKAQATLKSNPALITSINQSLTCQLFSEEIKTKVTLQSLTDDTEELPSLLERLMNAPLEVRSIFMTDRMYRLNKVVLERWNDRKVDMEADRFSHKPTL